MNYLAHIYLSRNQELISIGNFMADHVKGRKYSLYPKELQIGILLHRQIDSYTDAHAISRRSKRRLDEQYGLYKGVIIDIFYDHMLAKNWSLYAETPLDEYAQQFYTRLRKHHEVLPDKVKFMSQYLMRDNWLLSYAQTDGIQKVLEGMNRRTGGLSKMNLAIKDLEEHYEDFETDFKQFFTELCEFSDKKMIEIKQMYD